MMNAENQDQKEIKLTEKEAKRRKMMLSENEMKAILLISLPLVFYNSLGQIFQLIDTWIAANMSANVVSTVSFVAQIEKMLSAIATGLSIGGGILVARSFGSGNMEKVRQQISTLFFMTVFIGGTVISIAIPLMYPFLNLMGMPKELLAKGTIYSSLSVISIIFQFLNTIYFSVQKSRGNTKVIMMGNFLVLAIKTSLNIVLITLIKNGAINPEKGMFFLPASTITAHATLTVIALKDFLSKSNPFRVSIKCCTFNRTFLVPLANLGIPVFLEKFAFALGKALVNSLSASVGTTAVGALGVSDRICGLSTNPITGFQEAESSLISNNIGNQNYERAIRFFYRTLILTISYVLVLFFITGAFREFIIHAFAKEDANFAIEINKIYTFERWDTILMAINTAVMGLLYGFGKTRITMIINIVRLFVFRIPPLLIFLKVPFFSHLGIYSVGISMLISNGMSGIVAGIVAIFFIRKVKKDKI